MIYVDTVSPSFGQGPLGAAPADQSIEAKVRKFCKDWKLPEASCVGLIQCAKERSWKVCAKEIVAVAAIYGCAQAGVPVKYAAACGVIARWLIDQISFVGRIGGCDPVLLREIAEPADPRVGLNELNLGEFIRFRPSDGKFYVYMMAISCVGGSLDGKTFVIEKLTGPVFAETAGIEKQTGRQLVKGRRVTSPADPEYHLGAGASATVAKDWNENEWVSIDATWTPVEQTAWKKPFVFQPLVVQYKPYVPPIDYPLSAFAIFDRDRQKYRILTPTQE